ncbi:MAG: hypothetical protein RIR69_1619, partial [Actinomycetota bacterium]
LLLIAVGAGSMLTMSSDEVAAAPVSISVSPKLIEIEVGEIIENLYSITFVGSTPSGFALYSHNSSSNSYGDAVLPPSGLTFNYRTGLMSGVATQAQSTTKYWILDEDGEVFDFFTLTILPDTEAPTVVKVTTLSNDQTFASTHEILIQVHFSEIVTVSTIHGSPTLTLAVRDSGYPATYQSGSGTTVLTFSYVVHSGDNSDHLDYVSANSLVLNQSTIHDGAANQANLALPSPGSLNSLFGRHHIVIDTESPGVEISRSGNQILTEGQDALVLFDLTEDSSDFSLSCIEIADGTLSSFSGSGHSYSVVVTPDENSSGNVVVTVNQNSFGDSVGNRNSSIVTFSIPFDTKPVVVEEAPDTVTNQTEALPDTAVSAAVPSAGESEQVTVMTQPSRNTQQILERKTLPRVGVNAEHILFVASLLLLFGLSMIANLRKRFPVRQKL